MQRSTIYPGRPSRLGRVLPIHVAMELAGHASMETTRKYYLAVTASLFYTSHGPARASGPKSCQDRPKSCIRCIPIQIVCGPGGSRRFRLS